MPLFARGRFPALDRLDLIESGRLVAGSDEARSSLPRPSSQELLITGAEFALDYLAGIQSTSEAPDGLGSMRLASEDAVEEIRAPELLVSRGVRRVTKLVLFPVRFLYTAATGRVGTNEAAVEHYLDDREAPSAELVAAARAWRTGGRLDDIARLSALDRGDLVAPFQEWRERLTG